MHFNGKGAGKDVVSFRQLLICIIFVFIVVAAFLIRLDNYFSWNYHPDLFFANNEPVLINLDGYYYLALAQDVLSGKHSAIDSLRAVPDAITKPSPIPLLPVLLASLASTGVASLNWIAQVLPAFLGLMVALPMYLLCRRWGGDVMAIVAIVFVLFAPNYLARSSMGMLDTDCLNVFFAMFSACSALYFGVIKDKKRYYALAVHVVFFVLFLWWWDQTPPAVVILSIGPLVISALVFYRPRGRERLWAIVTVLSVCLLVLLWKGPSYPVRLLYQVGNSLSYISKQDLSAYPNIGITINEQVRPSWDMFILLSSSYAILFYCSLAGLIWLSMSKLREVLVLLPVAVVGAFSIFSVRFTIFLSPVLGLGMGYLCYCIFRLFPEKKQIFFKITLLGLIVLFLQQMFMFPPVRNPMCPGYIIQGMQRLAELTPLNAVVWSYWDEGHPLIYWSKRGTVNDGMVHSGKRTHFNALPMATDSFRLSANFMQFYVERGMRGIDYFYAKFPGDIDEAEATLKNILSAGPGTAADILTQLNLPSVNFDNLSMTWLEFFYPDSSKPVYLFLDEKLLGGTDNIYWFGTWKAGVREGGKTLPTFGFYYSSVDTDKVVASSGATFDFTQGVAELAAYKEPIPIAWTALTESSTTKYFFNPLPVQPQPEELVFADTFIPPVKRMHSLTSLGMYELEIFKPAQYALFQDTKIANTIINRLYWRVNDYDADYFIPVDLKTPFYQIWEVRGDKSSSVE